MFSEHSYLKHLVAAKNLSKNPNFNYNLFSGIKNEKIYSYTPDFTDFSVLYDVMAILTY